MAKNVSILEGGSAKTMSSVQRLITDDQSGGLVAWVPEDERLIRTKHISENGTYVAAQEALYGFSKLTINVAGGSDGETVPTLEPDGEMQPTPEAIATEPEEFDEEYGVLEEDPEGTKETIKAPTGGKGSSVVGKDPETGDLVMVSVDPTTGQITKENLGEGPKAIAITVMPNKMSYHEGDTLAYAGIEVKLYSKYEEHTGQDGSITVDAIPYTDSRYPDGKIPIAELDFPMTYVGEEVEGYEQWISPDDEIIVDGLDISSSVEYVEDTYFPSQYLLMGDAYVHIGYDYGSGKGYVNITGDGQLYMTINYDQPVPIRMSGVKRADGSYDVVYAWKDEPKAGAAVHFSGGIGDMRTYGTTSWGGYEVKIDGRSVRYGGAHRVVPSGELGPYNYMFYCTRPRAESVLKGTDDAYARRLAWYMWYGYFVRNRIPVKWKSPYDGKQMETSFTIQVAREDGGD